ncbi:MAG TPA: DUF177 domain-containing protein [Candidatus Dormibacteraeota bacterium]|nr:DUF177 domain-containing protein [Candidatus Dormibacteraeota bacterium]
MPQRADTIDLETLHLKPGEGRRLDIRVRINPVELGGQSYAIADDAADTTLDVSRTVSGYALRLRFDAPVSGACMRCMADANPVITVDAREVDQPGDAEELHSPYLEAGLLDLAAWSRDALVLAMPAQIVCRDDCKGLCAICGADLNEADPSEHRHAEAGDPRWAKLRDLKLSQ